jgi:hypothetical protein
MNVPTFRQDGGTFNHAAETQNKTNNGATV